MTDFDPPSRFPLPASFPLPKGPPPWNKADISPLDFLLEIMRSNDQPMDRRMEAAKAAAPYRHKQYRPVKTREEQKVLEEKLYRSRLKGPELVKAVTKE
jgi:hypothetical protein